jgi:putative ABC transport system ATP-binding protein
MSKIIETHGLWKIYPLGEKKVEALRGLSLSIESGAFVVIAGPSGSGKSTLLHLLGAMDTPTRGEVYLDGVNLSRMADEERTYLRCHQIGFIFQTFNLLPTLTALENVEIALRLAGASRSVRHARAAEVLARVGLTDQAHHRPAQLSGGERQRVVIARALANRPRLLLADEPTGNLDSVNGQAIVDLFHQLNIEGQTIVMVTHNLGLARYAHQKIILIDGQIVDTAQVNAR